MKIFNKVGGFESKVNFVDENNVVLGYNLQQSCCEHADWFIASRPNNKIPRRFSRSNNKKAPVPNLAGWLFDKTYFKECGQSDNYDHMAIFRIVRGKQKKYIHIFNCHNGYYSHGFEFKSANEIIKDGHL